MFRRASLFVPLAFVLAFPMLNHVALAHHSRAAYSQTQTTLKGTVVEYDWGNPHVRVGFNVKDSGGNVVRWMGELASVTTVISDGLTKNSLKPGDEVLITGFPAKDGGPFCVVTEIRWPDGRILMQFSRGGAALAAGYKEGGQN